MSIKNVYKTDTPSGSLTPAIGQTVAKLIVSNADNQDYYSAVVKAVNLNIAASGIGGTVGAVKLNLYQDSAAASNLVATVSWPAGSTIPGGSTTSNVNFVNSPVVEIARGASRTLIVTIDTANLAYATPSAISVSVPQGGIVWRDGVINSDITSVNSLPLQAKTLIY